MLSVYFAGVGMENARPNIGQTDPLARFDLVSLPTQAGTDSIDIALVCA
jgi:hypothetical protein